MGHPPSQGYHQDSSGKNGEDTDHTFAKMIAPDIECQWMLSYSREFPLFTLWNVESIIHIVVHGSMRNRCIIQRDRQQEITRGQGTHLKDRQVRI